MATDMATDHVHHWLIAMQAGPTSRGTCACGEEREFRNGWGERSAGPLRAHAVRRWRP